jgi:hypothetical protein
MDWKQDRQAPGKNDVASGEGTAIAGTSPPEMGKRLGPYRQTDVPAPFTTIIKAAAS